MTDRTVSLDDAIATQKRLRDALGLPEERFPLPAFIGMISDEIERMRDAGRSDQDVAAIVNETTGLDLTPDDIARHYATADQRHPGKP